MAMERAVRLWLTENDVPQSTWSALLRKLGRSYTIYGHLLLLPPNALSGPEWDAINTHLPNNAFDDLCALLSKHLKITNIALNKPIPPLQTNSQDENILRAPTNFTPIYGDFGPSTCDSPPTEEDFDAAFWTTCRQNGISQSWAPRWTMFSRGNVSEKARLLTLASVARVVEEGRLGGMGSAAVDLYCGIGYFAFSYVKAGVGVVLGWDLNAWSVEGLRRGARGNKWEVEVFDGEEGRMANGDARLLVFNESNELAPERIARMKGRLPPIRHVNCGMLPSSRASLLLAAKVLDAGYDGWVHVHENFLVEEIEAKAERTMRELKALLDEQRRGDVRVEVEFVNRLKSYAPGVMHCVIDIFVGAKDMT
ncbi:unnamed protein product [Zymoseptoria tritici ST99CH_1E4]|uniref:tRNA wybutosine-synthesizing protein 2 n=1 Tax=Zymoseptoria tritici ST99CH_1E4 TaxID=1276532 RepID=A0A2H1GXW4_ZYMTR|nr:unnamed protein product [Zymoseptoria tritici ST99CH_1E4]